ncbi:MAG: cytochrome C oxidase subunit I [Bacteroidetes bacterium]|nr:cytochrome C oxidase subunit I [Bacteroidota bacterium]
MFAPLGNTGTSRTTSYKVVLPFYVYSAAALLAGTVMLFSSSSNFLGHYFHPHILAITHTIALGWGTMIILGASHQLVPVMVEGQLYSNRLATISFWLAAIGIPLLVYGFYQFNMGWPAKWGGRFVVLAILAYLINLGMSIYKSKNENVHAVFIFTSVVWLFLTAFFGLALVYNFTYSLMPNDSLHYLPLHVHAGVVGWFLLLVIGVASRLIPMFLISKYSNAHLLWRIYWLINGGLICYVLLFYLNQMQTLILIPGFCLLIAILLFVFYCYRAFKQRMRKQVDEQMKLSLLSVIMILVPIALLFLIISIQHTDSETEKTLPLTYGFVILFGWITAIIFGMTFKTLPFIVWNKVYHLRAKSGKSPNPKDLFNHTIFNSMSLIYIIGFISFALGLLIREAMLLKTGSLLLLISALLYNWNVVKVVYHQPKTL